MAPALGAASLSSDSAPRWSRSALVAVLVAQAGLAASFAVEIDRRAHLAAPAPTPMLIDRNGVFLAQFGHRREGSGAPRLDYGFWPLDPPPQRIARATLALEDRRFAAHPGVDLIAMASALWRRASGERRGGASTIAMQIARMQQPAPRSVKAKLFEAATALALTARFGRDALLAHYLRLAPYGAGSHGVAHAARLYFDKPAADLSWAEIALLSAIPQSPTRLNPLRPDGLFKARRRGARALGELARQKVIDAAELALAHAQLKTLAPQLPTRAPDALGLALRYEAMLRHEPLSATQDPRLATTVDLGLQARLTALLRRSLSAWKDAGAQQGAAIVIKRRSGEVLAAIGSSGYRDRAGAFDFTRVARSPGSTLKPFIYALALERGATRAGAVLADLPEGASGVGEADGHFLGPMSPRQALANSRNVPATALLRAVGLDETLRFFRRLGLVEAPGSADRFGVAMALGALPTTLERLARAYGAFGDDGRLSDLVWFKDAPLRASERVMSVDSARLVTSFLSDPLARLPSFARFGPLEYPFAAAVKTGTSQGYRDALTAAFSQDYLVAVWIGRPDAAPMRRLTGANSAARLARAILIDLHKSRPGDLRATAFAPPAGRIPVELCLFGGRRAPSSAGCGQTMTEWLRPDEIAPPGGSAPPPVLARHRAWADHEGFSIERAETPAAEIRLAILSPENDSRIWRNPEAPAALSRIALKAVVEPWTPQVVWHVDGAPYALADPDKPVYWPLQKGAHRFELRLPLRPGASKIVRVTIE